MEHLTRAIFEAAAWIMYARSRHMKIMMVDCARLLNGDYGTMEINPYWAGFPDVANTYSRYAMQERDR